MSAGIGAAGFNLKLWYLTDLDRGETYVGQFIPQRVTKRVAGNIAASASMNRQYPILQWVSGELETITFEGRMWAKDNTDMSLQSRLKRLESLVKKDNTLGRPPLCSFFWGIDDSLEMDCLVQSIGGVTYDEIRPDGTLRGVSFTITLQRYEELTFVVTDPTAVQNFTRIRRSKTGETYEAVALHEYGDPELGILLRQLNPRDPSMALGDLEARDPVHMFPESYLVTLPVEPEFHAFKSGPGNEVAEQRAREMFDDRSDDSWTTLFSDTAPGEFL